MGPLGEMGLPGPGGLKVISIMNLSSCFIIYREYRDSASAVLPVRRSDFWWIIEGGGGG